MQEQHSPNEDEFPAGDVANAPELSTEAEASSEALSMEEGAGPDVEEGIETNAALDVDRDIAEEQQHDATTKDTPAPGASAAPSAPAADDTDETEQERVARERENALLRLFQATVFGKGGEKIGRVGQVYQDDRTLDPNWVTVKMGLFGTKESFIPLDEAQFEDKRVTVPYSKEQVLTAPRTEVDQNLSPAEEDDLYNYYQVPGRMTDTATDDDAAGLTAEATPDATTEEVDAAAVEASQASDDTTPVAMYDPADADEISAEAERDAATDTAASSTELEDGLSPFAPPASSDGDHDSGSYR